MWMIVCNIYDKKSKDMIDSYLICGGYETKREAKEDVGNFKALEEMERAWEYISNADYNGFVIPVAKENLIPKIEIERC